jgi:NAD-dependent protein deacetylase/lipoamidase
VSSEKRVVVLSGAGVSQESGLKTFRDAGGLWEGYDVMEVASIQGWNQNPDLVLEFYNQRRKQALLAKPNKAHYLIAELQDHFEVQVITQNVDNLHEDAGSKNVIHLHGKLFESKSSKDDSLIYPVKGTEINPGDLCELGSQLRPNIVWFGEMVPLMEDAIRITSTAEYLIVVGTSLVVYPAASLINFVGAEVPVFVVDPNSPEVQNPGLNVTFFKDKASVGMEKVFEELLSS